MSLPACPKCNSEYTYDNGMGLITCPECSYEFTLDSLVDDNTLIIKDSVGNILSNGDNVVITQDLPVKGMKPIKKGIKVKNIYLIDASDNNGHDIEAKVEGFGKMLLKGSVVKKIN